MHNFTAANVKRLEDIVKSMETIAYRANVAWQNEPTDGNLERANKANINFAKALKAWREVDTLAALLCDTLPAEIQFS